MNHFKSPTQHYIHTFLLQFQIRNATAKNALHLHIFTHWDSVAVHTSTGQIIIITTGLTAVSLKQILMDSFLSETKVKACAHSTKVIIKR